VGARTVQASVRDRGDTASRSLAVAPKPIVLVHGLNSNENSWINWTQPGGYLEAQGLP
jgi:pimeloyl-ACP methyl ester carboxylesterase